MSRSHVTRTITLRQLFAFISLVAVCLGLSVTDGQYPLVVFTWFLPGAYLATTLRMRSHRRFAYRARAIGRDAALGGAISCIAGVTPLRLMIYLNYWGWLDRGRLIVNPLRSEVLWLIVTTAAFALLLGAVQGFVVGWLSAKVFRDWDRRRRWRNRRERYSTPAS